MMLKNGILSWSEVAENLHAVPNPHTPPLLQAAIEIASRPEYKDKLVVVLLPSFGTCWPYSVLAVYSTNLHASVLHSAVMSMRMGAAYTGERYLSSVLFQSVREEAINMTFESEWG